ncbi:high affinity cAMP-specific and IBMX-insensitive 3',5'-cyclic phosphodiesterase 8-like isoform X2 [Zootermopsis nevadensis]|uniref:high affinity cAMP-specific and IBMX-insensitive 3',5'-cyclic phosphodiesterase 8-like isoform X2 n=1 Tax=Zootermopsis nevadensis TaxID=136037 RepID=UPI000B8E8A8C|nr:high affinity cAMP-specific and IBMX-insensitive 3',5'-cyclic phosphodiesterase 8-like isoform X2 [Zootermopsis nevadensis]
MGCTPSFLHHHHHYHHQTTTTSSNSNHRNGSAEDTEVAPADSTSNSTHMTSGSTSSPRSLRLFKKSKVDKTVKSSKSTTRAVQNVLLAFGSDDLQGDAICSACEELGYEFSLASTRETVLEAFQATNHEIVVIDTRNPKIIDGESICKALRSLKTAQYTVIVGVVRRSTTEKEDSSVAPLLSMGFNRVFTETYSLVQSVNELLQLYVSDVQPRLQLSSAQAAYVALDKCSDVVHITDQNLNIQYMNRSSERFLGFSMEDVAGKSLLEANSVDNRDLMVQQLQRGREWEGVISWRRKTGDCVVLSGRVIPVYITGRSPTHYVFIHESQSVALDKRISGTLVKNPELPKGTNNRKGSADLKSISSDGLRRQSIAKLHNLSIEAPITKVIALITSVQENASLEDIQTLDKVIDILRTTELYSPQLKDDKGKPGDPVTNDLIGALLSSGPAVTPFARRSSSDSGSVSRIGLSRSTFKPVNMSHQMKELLDTSLLWDFDIFKLEELSSKRPLVYLGMNLMNHFDVSSSLGCDENVLHNWLVIIEMNYNSKNSYHTSTHAADVMQATAGFLERERLKQILDPLDEAVCLVAAAAHDVDHPGKSSAFLCNSNHELAILYNDLCVLESHHSALAFKLTMSDDRVNIFKCLERDVYKAVRQNVIDMILATEMTRHFEHLAKFVNVFSIKKEDDSPDGGRSSPDIGVLTAPENITLIKRMLIKCADVSNPTRPVRMCVEWAVRIAEEYFNQTDEEKENHLPVVMPLFDRATCSIPKSQIGFMDFIINDMFETWEAFIEMPELLQNMQHNYKFWKEKEKFGIHRIQDVITMQRTWKD